MHENGEKDKSTFVFFLFLTNGFGFFHSDWLRGMPINKYMDFALLYMAYVAINHLVGSKRKNYLKFPIFKWFNLLGLYLTAEFIFTVYSGREFFGMSLAVYRYYLCFFSFILYKDLTKSQLRNVIVYVSVATMVATVVYVTQPIHNLPILDYAPTARDVSDELGVRYRNIPELLYFILIYITIRFDFSKWKSVLILSLCGMSMVLTQHRGVMMGYVTIVALYIVLSRNLRKAFLYGLMSIVGFAIVGSKVMDRFENKGHTSTFEDISYVINLDYSHVAANEYETEGGTLAFRVLLFVERFDYFMSNPQYLLTGVGMRHEDSTKTRKDFNFMLGAWKYDHQTGEEIRQQIDCADLVWLNPFMRFGLIGLLFHLYITYLVVVYLFKNRDKGTIAMATFLYYVLLIIVSMKNSMLFGLVQIPFLFLLIELIRRTNTEDADDRINYQEFRLLGNC